MGFQNGFRVNTNTSAVNTYRSYSAAQSGLERNIERLSSGLRINRAADDTAGAAISQRMNNQIRGMQQANRNVQQANNLLQSAEGGLNEIHGILSRMRELAVQSASDGMNADDRASIELEYSQLKAEITRIGDGTEYNNMKLIDGSRAKNLTSNNSFKVIESTDIVDDSTLTADASFSNVQFTFGSSGTTVTGSDGGTYTISHDGTGSGVSGDTATITNTSTSKTLTFDLSAAIAGLDGVTLNVGSSAMTKGVASTKVSSFTQNGTYTFTEGAAVNGADTITLTAADGTAQTVTKAMDGSGNYFQNGSEVNFDDLGIVIKLSDSYTDGGLTSSTLEVNDGVFTTIQVGSNNDADQAASVASVRANATENRITFNIADATSEGLGISTTDLDSLGEAQSAINYLDAAIEKINDERGNIGSLQNRFEFASSNLMNSIQNNSASMSTIRDADFAVEAADLARNQILTQSGTAMLAQANSLSQNVLSLLR